MYSTVKEVMNAMDRKNLATELKAKGETVHNFNTHEQLAEKYLNLNKPQQASSESSFRRLAQEVANSKREIKKDPNNKTVNFISKNFNYRLSPLGQTKDGKSIRYVPGYSTLSIEDQKKTGDIFPMNHILFRGIEGKVWKIDGFEGKGFFSTSNKTLIEFLETNNRCGSDYIIYDTAKKTQKALEDDMKITKMKSAVYNGSKNDLIRVISFLDMKNQANTFKVLNNIVDENVLIQKALAYVTSSPDSFLNAMDNPLSRLIFLANLAESKGALKVSSDERTVSLGDNNKQVCSSSLLSDWQQDVAEYLVTPAGKPLLERLELRCGYSVR